MPDILLILNPRQLITVVQKKYRTNRLQLNPLILGDAAFICELFNTEHYIKFIGDRNIKTREDALKFIHKTADNSNINYWIVKLKNDEKPVGLISFIKRDYLDHYDLGFAFLPEFSNKGYAFEAAEKVLNDFLPDPNHQTILAITMVNNHRSIKLIEKLGFRLDKEIEKDNEKLFLYSINPS